MSSAEKIVPPTSFINVQVISIPHEDPVTHKIEYQTIFLPKTIVIKEHDTVINYQLIEPTPEGVQFKGMSVKPKHSEQLSLPSISRSGKLITFSDANTVAETLNITLHFKDTEGTEFNVDPELINEIPG